MKIQFVKSNINSPYFCAKKKYLSPALDKVEIERVKIKNTPFYETAWCNQELGIRDIEKISKAIDKSSSYQIGDDGYPKMKANYLTSFYSLPISFALSLKEMQKKGIDTHIIDEVPPMFEGLDMKLVCRVLDSVGIFLEDFEDSKAKVNIDGRDFEFSWLDLGTYGNVYKITSESYPPLAIKFYRFPNGIGSHGPFGEIALERELNRAGVIDVPKFYMASPLGETVLKGDKGEPCSYACWKVSELITEDTPMRKGYLTLNKFLLKKGLIFQDRHEKNFVGNYWVDLGGITGLFGNSFYEKYSYGNICPIMRTIDNPRFYEEFFKEDKDC